MQKYKVADEVTNGKCNAIEFCEAPYDGMIFSFGSVTFDGDMDDIDGELKIMFEYDVHKEPNEKYTHEEMTQHLGDFLISLIEEQLKTGEIVYSGGTDVKRPTRDE